MLYNDVLEEFLMECEIRNLSSRTIETYKLNNELFARWLTQEYGMEEVGKVGKLHIKGYIIHLKRNGYKESYINTKMKSLKVFFKYLVEEDYLDENVMQYIKPLKEPCNVIDTFSDDKIKRLVHYYKGKDFISVRNRLIIELLIDTVIRCTELRMLEDDFVFDYYIKLLVKGINGVLFQLVHIYKNKSSNIDVINKPISVIKLMIVSL